MDFDTSKYDAQKKLMSVVGANVVSLAILAGAAGVFGVPFAFIWMSRPDFEWNLHGLWLILLFIVLIVVHELIHGLVFMIKSKRGFKSVKFGFIAKYVMPYCHCEEVLKRNDYILAALMPLLLVGLLPAVLSLFTGSLTLLALGVLGISGAAGDIMIVKSVLGESRDCLIYDLLDEPGCIVYRPQPGVQEAV
jgi:hypothetical protein